MKKNILFIIVVIVLLSLITSCSSNPTTSEIEQKSEENMQIEKTTSYTPSPTLSITPTNTPTIAPSATPEFYSLGDTVIFNGAEITFTSLSVMSETTLMFDSPEYVVVFATAKFTSDEIQDFNFIFRKMIGPDGSTLGMTSGDYDNKKILDWASNEVSDGESLEGFLAYSYIGDGEYTLILDNFVDKYEFKFDVVKE